MMPKTPATARTFEVYRKDGPKAIFSSKQKSNIDH